MIEHPVARHAAVAVAMRPRESGAGGGERLEAEALQVACASHVPWIGNDEATRLVQFVKCAALIGNAGTDVGHAGTPRGGVRRLLCARRRTCARGRTRAARAFQVPYRR